MAILMEGRLKENTSTDFAKVKRNTTGIERRRQ
jgi:hypothetical protein